MKNTYLSWARRLFDVPLLTALFLVAFLLLSPCFSSLADDTAISSEEAAGIQAFWDFFGPDGVNECFQPEADPILQDCDAITTISSDEQAILTTAWETVGGGRINRKYLNGLIAFCYDEELAFPHGASYDYLAASDAAIHGQAAAIAQRYGRSGVDNAQWWSECQVAIWAVRAGCQSYDSAAAFARSYCADRKITDPATVADYAYIVGTLVAETVGASDIAYLYQAADPENQRLLTYLSVWPDPAPTYPSPKYDRVSAEETYTASRNHRITIDQKSASVTGELLAGAIFEVYENERLVGTITTDAQGKGTCQWTSFTTASISVTKDYCSNYDELDPEIRKTITGYTNRDDAYSAAKSEAMTAARAQAETLADSPSTVTVHEITVPTGFSPTADSRQTVILTGDDSAILSVVNTPWSATFLIYKTDGTTGEPIPDDASFALYEWNGIDYQISPHYRILRRDDGVYTVTSSYPDGQPGRLYYTQQNQGRFALAETAAPDGYYLDPDLSYFTIQQKDTPLYGHNADPRKYDIGDDTKFANQPKPQPLYDMVSASADVSVSRTHQLTLDRKTASITDQPLAGAVFQIYEDGLLVGTITSDAQGQGSCQWEITETAQATVTKSYCSNYNQLEPEEKNTVTGFLSKEDALAAAQAEATLQAQRSAEELADQPRTVTVKETFTPDGFLASEEDIPQIIMSGESQATFSAVNTPWSSTLLIHKVDSITGETIPADASFTLYEWNGTDYQISPHYHILRRDDGIYTVTSNYPDGLPGHLYYTQKNQGRFALAETTAPEGYLLDPERFSFEITADGQTIWAHNATPERYPLCDDTTFANEAVTGTIQITKTGDYLTKAVLSRSSHTEFQYTPLPVSGASFAIYSADNILVATVITDAKGIAFLDGLPLGTYHIHEITAGDGDFLLNPTVATVTLSYKDQFTAVVVDDSTHYHNQRQKIALSLTKTNRPLGDVLSSILPPSPQEASFESTSTSPFGVLPPISVIQGSLSVETLTSQVPLSGAVYGLYTEEDIFGYYLDETTGSVNTTSEPLIPAHTLLERVTTDTDGQAFFTSDLPCSKYYIRELEAPAGYLPDTDIYNIDASYSGQEGEVTLQLSCSFDNDPICLMVTKINSHDQAPLTGAQLALYHLLGIDDSGKEDWELVAQWTSEATPKLLWALPTGSYRLTEKQAPRGYQLAEPVDFVITENTPLITLQMINEPIPPQIPQEPKLPSSPGTPTGDDSPFTLSCWCLLGSFFLLIRSGIVLLSERRR